MIVQLLNISPDKLPLCEADILLNRSLIKTTFSNMYEILFDCPHFEETFNTALQKIKEYAGNSFETYVKNMWGYVQSEEKNDSINFNIPFRDQLLLSSEYSFIYLIKSSKTNIYLKSQNGKISLSQGDMLIFRTNDFLKEDFDSKDRIALIGSVTGIKYTTELVKKVLI